jgi:hypothetical protein
MSFLKTNDVTKLLKGSTSKDIHLIIDEIASFPLNGKIDLEEKNIGTTFTFDGTVESFNSVISNIGIENKALKSSELEWISLVLKNMGEHYHEHNLGALKGVLIFKNEMLVCFIKKVMHQEMHQDQTEDDASHGGGRYIKIAYESIRNILTDSTILHQKCMIGIRQDQSSKFFPNLENLKYLMFGIVTGVIGYTYLQSKDII